MCVSFFFFSHSGQSVRQEKFFRRDKGFVETKCLSGQRDCRGIGFVGTKCSSGQRDCRGRGFIGTKSLPGHRARRDKETPRQAEYFLLEEGGGGCETRF